MSRFPFFKEISGRRALIVGGGEVALRRARMLVDFGAKAVCVAPEFHRGFAELAAERIVRRFEPSDILEGDIVIAAANDPQVNQEAAKIARERGCEVCVCDDPEAGTFHFPAVVRRGGMTVGISSSGASPSASRFVRERIEEAIPDNFAEVLDSMEMARRLSKVLIPEQKARSHVLRQVFAECLNAQKQPDENGLNDMMRGFLRAELD